MKKCLTLIIGIFLTINTFAADSAPSQMNLASAHFLLKEYPDNYHALQKIYENYSDLNMHQMADIAGDYITLLYPEANLATSNIFEIAETQPQTPFQEVTQKLIDKAVTFNNTKELIDIELELLKKIERSADDPNFLVLLSQNLHAREEYSRATMALRRVTLHHPNDFSLVKNYLFLLEKCKLYAPGMKEIARLSPYHESNDDFRRFAMVFARESQRFAEGISLGSNWTRRFPKDPEAWIFFGEMKLAQREFRDAYSAYAKASQLSGNNPNIYFQLARICYQLDEKPEAAAWIKRYREKTGRDVFIKKLLDSEMSGDMEFLDLLQ